jgi:hypothetical protein
MVSSMQPMVSSKPLAVRWASVTLGVCRRRIEEDRFRQQVIDNGLVGRK